MQRSAPPLVLTITVAALAAVVAVTAGASGGRRITVTNYGEMEPVVFDRTRQAQDLGCVTCHHPKGREGAHRCGACHGPKASEKAMRLEDAAHEERAGKCWGRHLGPKAQKKLGCEDCHSG